MRTNGTNHEVWRQSQNTTEVHHSRCLAECRRPTSQLLPALSGYHTNPNACTAP